MKIFLSFLCVLSALITSSVFSDEADVIDVKIRLNSDKSYHFEVTVKHQDEGWNHYVNKWEVLSPSGKVLAVRVLHHPHVNEQPFTRSLFSVKIPSNIMKVTVRVYDSVHHYGGIEKDVSL